jgi:SAM-dependent methyltransferase
MDEIKAKKLRDCRQGYEEIYRTSGFADEEESYKVVACLLKGKKALDIGCGWGALEKLCPQSIFGVDFSFNALNIARKNGAKFICQALGEQLPFKNDAFDVSVSFGVMEHLVDPHSAVQEMARVSQVQIFIVHARLPYGLEFIRPGLIKIFGLKDQPVEQPFSMKQLKKMANTYGLKVIFEGMWNYVDLRWINKALPYGLVKWPSHHLLITIKSRNLSRRFTGKC